MGILDAYQESTDRALLVMDSRPMEADKPAPKRSAWSAPFRAVVAGAAEVAGNVMDTAGAFGQVSAAVGGVTPGFDPSYSKNKPTLSTLITGVYGDSTARQQSLEAMETLKTEGINWRTDEAQQAYKFGADLRPDPLTAGTAENLVFGLTKGLTKAIGAAVTLGPVGGAAAFGTSEGLTAAEDLATQGVDQATRTKVGAVTGIMSAAGVLMPVAGKTLAQTAGLVLAGGPASFMAQQQAIRSILENADYGEIAKQYDPIDPVGLTMAFGLPAGFAYYAKRGGFGAKPLPKADVHRMADGAPATQETAIQATPEAIDAAMVQNLTLARDVHQDTPAQKFAAEMWRGSVTENQNFQAWFDGSKATDGDGKPVVVYHGTAAEFDSFDRAKSGSAIDSGKLGEGFYFSQSPRWASSYAENAAKVSDGGANVLPVYLSLKNPVVLEGAGNVWEKLRAISSEWGLSSSPVIDETTMRPNPEWSKAFTAEAERRGFDGVVLPLKFGETEYVAFREDQIKSAIGNSGKFDKNSPSLTDQAVKESLTDQPKAASPSSPEITPDAYRARVDALLTEQPDLIARLDDAGQPVKLSDELAAIEKQAQEGTDTEFGALDAPLLKVAAECALSFGGM